MKEQRFRRYRDIAVGVGDSVMNIRALQPRNSDVLVKPLAAEETVPPADRPTEDAFPKTPAVDIAELVVFRLGSRRYAIGAVNVLETIHLSEVTALPGVPTFYRGLISHRGVIYPLVDIRPLIGETADGVTSPSRAMLFLSDTCAVALVADTVEFIQVDATAIASPPAGGDVQAAPAMCGMTTDSIVVLDIWVLLADARLVLDDPSFRG